MPQESVTGIDKGWADLSQLAPDDVVTNSGAGYDPVTRIYQLKVLNITYVISQHEKKITEQGKSEPVKFEMGLLILHYLVNAKNIPPSGKLLGARDLPDGDIFFRSTHELPLSPLKEKFGSNPAGLLEAAKALNGKRKDFADAAVEIQVLPRLFLTILVWKGDDEFPANASVLFDSTAPEHLALDVLLAAVKFTVKALTEKIKGT